MVGKCGKWLGQFWHNVGTTQNGDMLVQLPYEVDGESCIAGGGFWQVGGVSCETGARKSTLAVGVPWLVAAGGKLQLPVAKLVPANKESGLFA